jgi:threonine aldolase
MGGGMRQAGYLAAAGLHALQHHVSELKKDHAHAAHISQVLAKQSWVESMLPVQTNIIIFKLVNAEVTDAFQTYLKANDVLANKVSAQEIRFVFHLDVTPEMVHQLQQLIESFKA